MWRSAARPTQDRRRSEDAAAARTERGRDREIDVVTHKVKRIIRARQRFPSSSTSVRRPALYVANEDAAQVSIVDDPSGNVVARSRWATSRKASHSSGWQGGVLTSEDEALSTRLIRPRTRCSRKCRSAFGRARSDPPDGIACVRVVEKTIGAIAVVDAQKHRFLHLIQLEGKARRRKPRPMGFGSPRRLDVYDHRRLVRSCVPGRSVQEDRGPLRSRPVSAPGSSGCCRTADDRHGNDRRTTYRHRSREPAVKEIAAGARPWGVAVASRQSSVASRQSQSTVSVELDVQFPRQTACSVVVDSGHFRSVLTSSGTRPRTRCGHATISPVGEIKTDPGRSAT